MHWVYHAEYPHKYRAKFFIISFGSTMDTVEITHIAYWFDEKQGNRGNKRIFNELFKKFAMKVKYGSDKSGRGPLQQGANTCAMTSIISAIFLQQGGSPGEQHKIPEFEEFFYDQCTVHWEIKRHCKSRYTQGDILHFHTPF